MDVGCGWCFCVVGVLVVVVGVVGDVGFFVLLWFLV